MFERACVCTAILHTSTSQRNTSTFLQPKIRQKSGQLFFSSLSYQNYWNHRLITQGYITIYSFYHLLFCSIVVSEISTLLKHTSQLKWPNRTASHWSGNHATILNRGWALPKARARIRNLEQVQSVKEAEMLSSLKSGKILPFKSLYLYLSVLLRQVIILPALRHRL